MSDSVPMFEIGPGALLFNGITLTKGAPVPAPILAKLRKSDAGVWSIPGFEHCTRPVVRTSLVGVSDDAADLVRARQRVSLLEAQLVECRHALEASEREASRLGASLAVVEDERDAAQAQLASEKRASTRAKAAKRAKDVS